MDRFMDIRPTLGGPSGASERSAGAPVPSPLPRPDRGARHVTAPSRGSGGGGQSRSGSGPRGAPSVPSGRVGDRAALRPPPRLPGLASQSRFSVLLGVLGPRPRPAPGELRGGPGCSGGALRDGRLAGLRARSGLGRTAPSAGSARAASELPSCCPRRPAGGLRSGLPRPWGQGRDRVMLEPALLS
uniref:Uncharacterized protein LOC110203728 n=1 Tax=Phascolarctos cinereus TaxID=38626 RepID=A0A6P5JNJ9_PHACI|nr:uncharacterized protein LOC110203728 [Phascolarctos cinereus]